MRITPGKLPNWESGPQNQPRAKVAVSDAPERRVSISGSAVLASVSSYCIDISLPPLRATKIKAVIDNPNKVTMTTTHDLIINVTL